MKAEINGRVTAPDAEVVLRVGGEERCLCAFFKEADDWGVAIFTGIDDLENAERYALLFTQAGDAIRFSEWKNKNGVQHDDPPF